MQTLTTRAFLLASELHANQRRKASLAPGVPYLSHLIEVAGMVMASGAPEVVVAAAFLHDAIEDQGNRTRDAIREQLGSEVLTLVEECTEQGTGGATKAPWLERKEAALLSIPTLTAFAFMIRVADKLQNAREIYHNVSLRGDDAYAGFRVEKSLVLWYHREALKAMQQRLITLRGEDPHQPSLLITHCWLQDLAEMLSFLQSQ